MFRHLKAEDFVNLMEGAALSAGPRTHIQQCPQCRATCESMMNMQAEISSLETDIPEPEWEPFRSSVRNELLSRSIQRQSAVRRWTGWTIRPAIAWALSLLAVAGITTVTVLWNVDRPAEPGPVVAESRAEPPAELLEAGPEKALFDDVVLLGEDQQEQLRQMLESAQKGTTQRQ
jgi:hypothetical protein